MIFRSVSTHLKFFHKPTSTTSWIAAFLQKNSISTSSSQDCSNSKLTDLKDNWEPIYRLDKIKSVSVLAKVKNYQLAATILAVPISLFAFPDEFLTVLISGSTLSISLSFASLILKNVIGVIYTHNQKNDVIRFAYLDFWGRRQDIELNMNEIVPFSELPKSISENFYTKVKLYSSKEKEFKLLSAESKQILNKEKFNHIFGGQ